MLWAILTWSGGDPAYQIDASLIGSEWDVYVFDERSGKSQDITQPPTIDGTRLVMTIPLNTVSGLGGSFQWAAITEWDVGLQSFGDNVPDVGSVYSSYVPPQNRAVFPAS